MLSTQAIEPGTLSILKKLMGISALRDFYLVGGTALALKYNHRLSVDLDLFTNKNFDKEIIISELTSTFGGDFVFENTRAAWAVFCFIKNVKVDIIHYKHEQIAETEILDEDPVSLKGQTWASVKKSIQRKVNEYLK